MCKEIDLQRYIEANTDTFIEEIRELAFTLEDAKSLNYPKYLKNLIINSITSVNFVNSHKKLYIDNECYIIPDILLKDENGHIIIIELKTSTNAAKYGITQILHYYHQIRSKYKGSVIQNFVFIIMSNVWPTILMDAIEVLIDNQFPIIPINIVLEEQSNKITNFQLNFVKIEDRKIPLNAFNSEYFRGILIGWNTKTKVDISTEKLTDYAQLTLEKSNIDAIVLELKGREDLIISTDGIAIFVLNPFLYQINNLNTILENDEKNSTFILDLIYRTSSFSIEDIKTGIFFGNDLYFVTGLHDAQILDIYSMISSNGIDWEREIVKLKEFVNSPKYNQRWDVKSVRYTGKIREMVEQCSKWLIKADDSDLSAFFETDDLPNNIFGYLQSWYCFHAGFANIIFDDWDNTAFLREQGIIKKIEEIYSEDS